MKLDGIDVSHRTDLANLSGAKFHRTGRRWRTTEYILGHGKSVSTKKIPNLNHICPFNNIDFTAHSEEADQVKRREFARGCVVQNRRNWDYKMQSDAALDMVGESVVSVDEKRNLIPESQCIVRAVRQEKSARAWFSMERCRNSSFRNRQRSEIHLHRQMPEIFKRFTGDPDLIISDCWVNSGMTSQDGCLLHKQEETIKQGTSIAI
ncbi:hypothetical protein MPTK1_3g01770 [Marchantia polymorpha subsp. ruderalis]|uniref:Uncharacterized protein n=2 Tax=Marchantia polymorpha TaxID=3197 RepID=A0AAF6AWF2_MARPO|nr:hypothetical protein MARPO_0007s0169 [Marchantia polymorpha]BBN04086.1 hypothetical protein Mp_3g01770 [Marchantia polymorpha subsp. ruderalis]|eukprot:PTQ47773.1 hypothetical protein MARPO_0007s0169 [Marchantia polymorpha]